MSIKTVQKLSKFVLYLSGRIIMLGNSISISFKTVLNLLLRLMLIFKVLQKK